LGTLVQTADGRQLLHTPALAWMPGGGPNGTLVMSGQRVVTGSDGPTTVVRPETGRVVFVNTNLGVGAWEAVSAPLTIDPTRAPPPPRPLTRPRASAPARAPPSRSTRPTTPATTWAARPTAAAGRSAEAPTRRAAPRPGRSRSAARPAGPT